MTAPKTSVKRSKVKPQVDAIKVAITWLDESSFCEASLKCKQQLRTLLSTLASVEAERDRYKGALERIVDDYGESYRQCATARAALEATP